MAGGKPLSAEHRAKIAAANRKRKQSEQTRAKIAAAKLGKPLSAETRAKMSAAHIGVAHSEESRERMRVVQSAIAKRGVDHPRFGKSHTAEARAKIGAAHRGKVTARGPTHHSWGKSPPHGKRIAHKGHVFRSSYEVRCADALDRKGIKWQYEPKRFDLGDCTYLPDFYLPEQDVYWEVKGWLGPNSQRKINRFREVHPEIPLVVVTNSVLKLLEK